MPKRKRSKIILADNYRQKLIDGKGEIAGIGSPFDKIPDFKFYLSQMVSFIDKAESEDWDNIKEDIKKHELEEIPYGFTYPYYWDYIFRETLYSSFLIIICSYIERCLGYTVSNVKILSKKDIEKELKDFRGNIIKRSKKYLKTNGDFSEPSDDVWLLIEHIYQVRNIFVHEEGTVPNNKLKEPFLGFTDKAPGISIYKEGFRKNDIEIEKEFCGFCLQTFQEFFVSLRKGLKTFAKNQEDSVKETNL